MLELSFKDSPPYEFHIIVIGLQAILVIANIGYSWNHFFRNW